MIFFQIRCHLPRPAFRITVILGTNVCFGFGADGVFGLGNVTADFFGSVIISP
jgi:hypothetical protein